MDLISFIYAEIAGLYTFDIVILTFIIVILILFYTVIKDGNYNKIKKS